MLFRSEDLAVNVEFLNEAKIKRAPKNADADILAEMTRKIFGIDTSEQAEWKNGYTAFDHWKKALEDQGLLIFQMSFPITDARGFFLDHPKFPSIVVNTQDSINGRIFSLFHEFAHFLLGEEGICDMGGLFRPEPEDIQIEAFCNKFSGSFLVPEIALAKSDIVRSGKYDDSNIAQLSKQFNVSREVILRRLLALGVISKSLYLKKQSELQESYKRVKAKGGKRRPSRECISKNGVPFISLVLETRNQGIITHSDVSDYLSVKMKYMPEIEKIISSKA